MMQPALLHEQYRETKEATLSRAWGAANKHISPRNSGSFVWIVVDVPIHQLYDGLDLNQHVS
jgi:hypothetical protein